MLKLPYVRGQSGQAIVIIAFMTIVLFGAVGLALDGANGYQQNLMAERAAGAAALAGVIMEPNQPALALSRAQAEAKHNGYVDGVNGATVTVIHGSTYGQPREQKVTVCQQVGTFFMVVFGISQFNVCRTARAGYLSPISIGQPGNQLGSTVSSLGTGSNFYFMRTEGWGTDRQQGDGFTPNPCWEYGSNFSCAGLNADVHQFNGLAGTDPFSGGLWNLPGRGGYNYLVTIPQGGGSIWVYNAIYGPDFAGTRNHCENELNNPTCAAGNYYYHEEDGAGQVADGGNPANKNRYSAMKYTIFRVPNLFYRSNDVPLSTLLVKPIDATHWNDPTPNYWNLADDTTINQEYWGTGPANQHTYHSWVNARHYGEGGTSSHVTGPLEVDDGTAKLRIWNSSFDQGLYDLQPGTYRLRVDALNYDGTNFNTAQDGHSPQQSDAHKGYAVAVSAPGQGNGSGLSNKPTDCAALGCTLGAWNDISWYTPISIPGGGQYDIPIMNLTQQYRGQTIVLDFYDQGDVGGGGTVYAEIINPQFPLAPAQTDLAHPIVLIDSGRFRIPTATPTANCTPGSVGPDGNEHITNAPCFYTIGFPDPTQASYISYGSGLNYNNGHWIHMEMWIPDTYTPGADTYWKLRYRATGSITAQDTMTLKVGLKGSPAHLFES